MTRPEEVKMTAKVNALALSLLMAEAKLSEVPLTEEQARQVLDHLLNKTHYLVHWASKGTIDSLHPPKRPKGWRSQPLESIKRKA